MKKIIITLFACIFFFLSIFSLAISEDNNFSFIWLSDTHIGFSKTNRAFQSFIADFLQLKGDFEFIVNTGDISELGKEESLRWYKESILQLKLPIYSCIGNHDVRWSGEGKKIYQEYFGPTYFSFDYKGVHFIFLDTSIVLQPHGHISLKQLNWLKRDLAKVDKTTPIFVFSHHPLKWRGMSVDNGFQALKMFYPYNVRVFFNGHGHNLRSFIYNDIVFVQNAALYDGVYLLIFKEGYTLKIQKRSISQKEAEDFLKLSLKPIKRPAITIINPLENIPLEGKLDLEVAIEGLKVKQAFAQIEDGEKFPLQESSPSVWKAFIDLTDISPGFHHLKLSLKSEDDAWWGRETYFQLAGNLRGDVKMKMRELYSSPVIKKDILLVGDMEGNIIALNLNTHEVIWRITLPAGVIASPCIQEDKVFVATEGGFMYALHLKEGKDLWCFRAKAPIYSSPVVDGRRVYFGDGKGYFYALDIETGQRIWEFKAENFIQVKPAVYQGRICFGAWDRKFYVLNTLNGNLLWSKVLGKSIYYSPATSRPWIEDKRVYISGKDNYIYCFDLDTGREIWKSEESAGYSSPFLMEGTLYVATPAGWIRARRADNGEKIWERKVSDSFYGSSVVSDGEKLYICSLKGIVYCLNRDKGDVRWQYHLSRGYVFSDLVIDRDRYCLWAGSIDGNLYRLSLKECADKSSQ